MLELLPLVLELLVLDLSVSKQELFVLELSPFRSGSCHCLCLERFVMELSILGLSMLELLPSLL